MFGATLSPWSSVPTPTWVLSIAESPDTACSSAGPAVLLLEGDPAIGFVMTRSTDCEDESLALGAVSSRTPLEWTYLATCQGDLRNVTVHGEVNFR